MLEGIKKWKILGGAKKKNKMDKKIDLPAPVAHRRIKRISRTVLFYLAVFMIGIGLLTVFNQIKINFNNVNGPLPAPEIGAGESFSVLTLTLPAIFIILALISVLTYKIVERHNQDKLLDKERLAELVSYIKQALNEEQKESEIKINVLSAGWNETDFERAFEKASREK